MPEKLLVGGAMYASWYTGAAIGSVIVATAGYRSCGSSRVGNAAAVLRFQADTGIRVSPQSDHHLRCHPEIFDQDAPGRRAYAHNALVCDSRIAVTSWKNEKHAEQWINTLETYVLPNLGNRRIDAITPGDCADVLRPIWLTKAETASRTRQRMHAVMQWAWAHGHISANPVSIVDHIPPCPGAKCRNSSASTLLRTHLGIVLAQPSSS